MTNLPEAKLAREAEICYGMLALATDYDCWHETEDDVSVDAVLDVLRNNVAMAQTIVQTTVGRIGGKRECACAHALQGAVITDPSKVPGRIKQELGPLISRYLRPGCEDNDKR
jgi:5'-methylthioadenosine phosphorylase